MRNIEMYESDAEIIDRLTDEYNLPGEEVIRILLASFTVMGMKKLIERKLEILAIR